jgi:hypothetical protein
MAQFDVNVDLSAVLALSPIARAGIFTNLSAAVERVAMAGAERWKESVLKARLWDGERKAYADSIRYEMTGPYSAVIVSDYKYVQDIETGRPPYDLKRMLDTSTKVRTTKDGRRFLVIPFRDNTPGNEALSRPMPAAVHKLARQLPVSKIVGASTRASGERPILSPHRGMFAPAAIQGRFLSDPKTKGKFLVRKHEYQWGGHLTERVLRAAGVDAAQAKRYAGMHRFEGKTPGGKAYSSYVRFRIMMEGSDGWIIPAKPGLHIAEGVANGLRSDAETIFGRAIDTDLAAAS